MASRPKGDAMETFINHLKSKEMSQNTIDSYSYAVSQFLSRCETINDESLLSHKDWLVSEFAAKTANNRIGALNCYLDYIEYGGMRLRGVRVQQKPFLDNVISQAEYETLRNGLLEDNDLYWHFVVRFLACTGARISELRRMTVESIRAGHLDLISKGEKLRRIYIPKSLQEDALQWTKRNSLEEGFIFAGPNGGPMSARGISLGLKRCAKRYGVNPNVVYPHSFRHRFAKNFIAKNPDIAFLADLMGHESIETTRIYLRRTAEEQRTAVDEAVNW